MYLTRLQPDPAHGQARRDLSNPYDMHRTLVRAFVRGEGDRPVRFLWRLQVSSAWSKPELLVQSAHAGKWAALESVSGYLLQPAEQKQIVLHSWLKVGDLYRFRLRTNPNVCRGGKRFGLIGEEVQTTWLEQRGEQHGFRVESALVTGSEVLTAFKARKPVTLRAVTFDGYLECTDTASLEQALLAGVGRGKAFGLGLLSLARAGGG